MSKRFRHTRGDTIGIAVLLACMALPLFFHLCSSDAAPADKAAAEAAAQRRIDSAQHHDDSIRTARDSIREHKRRLRKAKRDSIKAAKAAAAAFHPDRNRLDETINKH